jgi:hypothetical protein
LIEIMLNLLSKLCIYCLIILDDFDKIVFCCSKHGLEHTQFNLFLLCAVFKVHDLGYAELLDFLSESLAPWLSFRN